MGAFASFFNSSVGAKIVTAITGFLLFVFVIGHMAGNLQVFLGPEVLNAYAFFLKSHVGLLWVARFGLFVTLVLHVYSTSRMTLMNRKARPVAYEVRGNVQSTLASRNMYVTGAMIFFFVVYHIAQFTLGLTNPAIYGATDPLGHFDVYRMVVMGFSNPFITGVYIIAMALLCLHLSHGVSSMFQSVGLNRPRYNTFVNAIGPLAAIVIFIGNCSMPIAVIAGWVK